MPKVPKMPKIKDVGHFYEGHRTQTINYQTSATNCQCNKSKNLIPNGK